MSANEKQVGGAHYRSDYQHWDFAVDADFGPFEYQITKYGTRHRTKAGKQDLEKSLHFTEKLIELAQDGYEHHHGHVTRALVQCYAQANALDNRETVLMQMVCTWTKMAHLLAVRQHIREMLAHYYANKKSARCTCGYQHGHAIGCPANPVDRALADGDAGPGYVQQDRCDADPTCPGRGHCHPGCPHAR